MIDCPTHPGLPPHEHATTSWRPVDLVSGRFLDGLEPLYVTTGAQALDARVAHLEAHPLVPKPVVKRDDEGRVIPIHPKPPISDDTYRALGVKPPKERR